MAALVEIVGAQVRVLLYALSLERLRPEVVAKSSVRPSFELSGAPDAQPV